MYGLRARVIFTPRLLGLISGVGLYLAVNPLFLYY
jgi:hypothetical protein